jgi:lysozyme family protein
MDIKKYIEFIKRWEGGLARGTSDSSSNHPCPTPHDGKTGWHTNCGVTYAAWEHVFGNSHDDRFYAMNSEDWFKVFKGLFWDKIKGSKFSSFGIAAIVTEIAWMSGPYRAGKILQKSINACGGHVDTDGNIGPKTVEAANHIYPQKLFDEIQVERRKFFESIGVGKNAKYLKGWINRLNDGSKTFRP